MASERKDLDRRRLPLAMQCASQECAPFSEGCLLNSSPSIHGALQPLEKNIDPENYRMLAREFCALLQRASWAEAASDAYVKELDRARSIAADLGLDQNTGLLTGTGGELVMQRLFDSGLMGILASQGMKARVALLDIDGMHGHNMMPGGHARGDMAIHAVGARFREIHARSYDITSLYDNPVYASRRDSVVSRSNERGDEFRNVSFVPDDSDLRLYAEHIRAAMSDISYSFKNRTYPVTVSFAVADLTIPETYDIFNESCLPVDTAMLDFKADRDKSLGSAGIIVETLPGLATTTRTLL